MPTQKRNTTKTLNLFSEIQKLMDNADINYLTFEKDIHGNVAFYSITVNNKKFKNTSIETAAISMINEINHEVDDSIKILNAIKM